MTYYYLLTYCYLVFKKSIHIPNRHRDLTKALESLKKLGVGVGTM